MRQLINLFVLSVFLCTFGITFSQQNIPASSPVITGVLERVSVNSEGQDLPYSEYCYDYWNCPSFNPSISEDGQKVIFHTFLSVIGDEMAIDWHHIYLRDRAAQTTTQLSYRSYRVDRTAINDNATKLLFETSYGLIPEDTNHYLDVYRLNLTNGEIEMASLPSYSNGALGNNHSYDCSISTGGRFAVFASRASNMQNDLAHFDTNGVDDIYLHDFADGSNLLVTFNNSRVIANGPSRSPSVSSFGTMVVFESRATNLTPDDGNDRSDIFIRDIGYSKTYLISNAIDMISEKPIGSTANGGSSNPVFGGKWVAFESDADNLVPNDINGVRDIFISNYSDIRENSDEQLIFPSHKIVSVASDGSLANASSWSPAISHDGKYVLFYSNATNLTEEGTPGIFIHDIETGETGLVQEGDAFQQNISDDNKHVVFVYHNWDFHGSSDNNDQFNIYVKEINWRPHADAGPDQILRDCSFGIFCRRSVEVTLDAGQSYDIDNDELRYEWQSDKYKYEGQQVTISLSRGTHEVYLIVTDEHGARHVDSVTIQVVGFWNFQRL